MFFKTLPRIVKNLRRNFYTTSKWKSDSTQNSFSKNKTVTEGRNSERTLPPEPSYCCMSGCANCVWIKYAQELTQLYDDGDVIARNKIAEKVQDPKLRAFLFTQLGLNKNEE